MSHSNFLTGRLARFQPARTPQHPASPSQIRVSCCLFVVELLRLDFGAERLVFRLQPVPATPPPEGGTPNKKSSPPLAFSKPGVIFIPLEVYMVNSPSRPSSRPDDPVECGGMTPLWNWETCLPVDRAVMPAPSPARGGDGLLPTIKAQSRQKPLQSCLIKPHQGKR